MSCSQCSKPCIKVGGKCIIALIREKTNCSFKDAWEAVTHVSWDEHTTVPFMGHEFDSKVETVLNKQHKLIKQNDNKNKKRIPSKV